MKRKEINYRNFINRTAPILVIIVLVVVNACEKHVEVRRAPLKQGDITEEGKLVITGLGNPAGNWFPIVLDTEYGIMILNDGDSDHPKPRLLLALQTEKRVEEYTEVETFQEALQRLPENAILYLYDQCSASTAYGVEDVRAEIIQFCREIGLQVSDEWHITCTCY